MELKIIASLTILDEADEVMIVNALHTLVNATREEEGNLSYDLYCDINNPLTYIFIEEWESENAIDKHNASPHFLHFVDAVREKVTLSVNVVKHVY